MRTRMTALTALLVALAACGGSGTTASSGSDGSTTTTEAVTTTTEAAGFTVTSEDGDLEVEVPPEAMEIDPGITISVLDPSEYPDEFAPFADAGSTVYSLEPDGLTFDAPVRVTRRIPAERFTGLPVGAIPVVTLLTTTADGEGYELLDRIHVLRDGEDIFVSGDLTHFSWNLAVSEPYYYRPTFAGFELGDDYVAPVDVSIRYAGEFAGYVDTGETLDPPSEIEAVGFTRHDDAIAFALAGTYASIDCKIEGEYRPRVGVQVQFDADDEGSAPAPQAASNFIPGLSSMGVMLKTVAPVKCLSEEANPDGAQIEFSVEVDHSGGVNGVGLSNGFGLAGRLIARFTYFGLIEDDGDGELDLDDRVHPPYHLDEVNGSVGAYVPLFNYGYYYPYFLAGEDFDGDLGGGSPVRMGVRLDELRHAFVGEWFPGSFVIVESGDSPYGFTVDAREGVQEAEDPVLSAFLWQLDF